MGRQPKTTSTTRPRIAWIQTTTKNIGLFLSKLSGITTVWLQLQFWGSMNIDLLSHFIVGTLKPGVQHCIYLGSRISTTLQCFLHRKKTDQRLATLFIHGSWHGWRRVWFRIPWECQGVHSKIVGLGHEVVPYHLVIQTDNATCPCLTGIFWGYTYNTYNIYIYYIYMIYIYNIYIR